MGSMVGLRKMSHLQPLMLAVALTIALLPCNANGKPPKALRFYIHVVRTPHENQTVSAVPLAGMPAQFSGFTIGYASAFDNKLTVAQDYNSEEIGRSRGFFVITSSDGNIETETITLSFYKYNGYMFCAGSLDLSVENNELIVVDGTGSFRDVQGRFKVERVERYGSNLTNSVFYGEVSL